MVRKNHRRASSHLVRRGVGTFPTPAANYCDTCLPAYQQEQIEQRFSGSGLAKLEALKADGRDPTHGQEAAVKRGAANARRKAEIRNWEQQYGKLTDLSAFEREILPLIQNVPLSRLAKTTGLSLRYVSQIRRGERTPHPRHGPSSECRAGTAEKVRAGAAKVRGSPQAPFTRRPWVSAGAWFPRRPLNGVGRSNRAWLNSHLDDRERGQNGGGCRQAKALGESSVQCGLLPGVGWC